jgi:succinate dehydrogenase / fumarate reductase membrane anchor subunit
MTTDSPAVRSVKVRQNYESTAWKWMRYSAFLLIPLVWIHLILQDVIVGVHAMDLGYVADRWASIGWRIYDALLLGFAFAHGVNGLRQVLHDFVHKESARKVLNWALFIFWLVVFVIGAVALIGGVNQPFPIQ